jgi:probable HAF family extracellular repeat protein
MVVSENLGKPSALPRDACGVELLSLHEHGDRTPIRENGLLALGWRSLYWRISMNLKTLAKVTVTCLLGMQAMNGSANAQEPVKHHHYKLIELGTFGGPTSYINPGGNGGPYMNHQGAVVGSSQTSVPLPSNNNGFVCVAGLDVYHGLAWGESGITNLPSPRGDDNCGNAAAINDLGEMAGQSENGLVDAITGVKEIRAVRWKDGQIESLGTFGGNHSAAFAINNHGQIVGFALNKVPDFFSLYAVIIGGPSAGTQTRAFVWRDGRMQDLHTLGGPDAWAAFVNERGQVAGISYTNSTPNSTTGFPTVDPFLWQRGKMIDLGTLGGTVGSSSGLNNRGQVIGQSNLAGDQSADPFLWDGEKLIDMFTQGVGDNFVIANAINDAGEVAGSAAFPNHPFDAAIWKNGVITDLGALPDECYSEAFALNSRGQVVGSSFPCDFSAEHAFVWENGQIFDLTTLIPPSGAQMVEPNALNDRGEIASDGLPPGCTDFNTCSQAYVLIPCEPDHSGEKDCEEGVEGTLAIQNNPVPVTRAWQAR